MRQTGPVNWRWRACFAPRHRQRKSGGRCSLIRSRRKKRGLKCDSYPIHPPRLKKTKMGKKTQGEGLPLKAWTLGHVCKRESRIRKKKSKQSRNSFTDSRLQKRNGKKRRHQVLRIQAPRVTIKRETTEREENIQGNLAGLSKHLPLFNSVQ